MNPETALSKAIAGWPPLKRLGKRAARFWLPLHVAPPMNRLLTMHWAKRRKLKQECITRMLGQVCGRQRQPIAGRPTVLAVRFSAVQPDQDSGWTKLPVDALKAADGGLGYLRDDSEEAAEIKTAWQRAPRNGGGVLLEVYT